MNVWMMVSAAGLIAVSLALVIRGVLAYMPLLKKDADVRKSMDSSG